MKRILFILLFISTFGFSQQLYVPSQKITTPDNIRCIVFNNSDVQPCTYYSVDGDSIDILNYGGGLNGIGYGFSTQYKDKRRFYWKSRMLRVGTGIESFRIYLQMWRNGSRIGYDLPASSGFTSYTLTTNYIVNVPSGAVAGRTYTAQATIDFSTFPSYDSCLVWVSYYATVAPTGTGAYARFHKNDFYIEPIENANGLTILNANLLGFAPNLFMPDTIYLTEGTSVEIYNDNVSYINLNYKDRISFDWSGTIGVETDTSLRIKATTIGNYSITLKAKDRDGSIRDVETAVVKVQPKLAIGNYTILPVGNSLTQTGWGTMRTIIDDTLNISLTSVGTQGTTTKHEGRPGWTYATFLNESSDSPFFFGGHLSYPQYFSTNLIAEPNLMRFSLGINECFAKVAPSIILANASRMIDSALVKTNCKIVITTPSTASNTYAGWDTNYNKHPYYRTHSDYENYIGCIRSFNELIDNKFSNNKYSNRVHVAYDGLFIDRNNGYSKTDGVHTNAVHPTTTTLTGYKQLVKGLMNIINKINQ